MKLYFAPLEGIGGYIYRNAQAEFFPKADKYFSPFLSPGAKKRLTPKGLRDVAPEHNAGIFLVPQILTNDAQVFLETERELHALGYEEVDLNLGCPSKTVVTKGRGAGFLADPDALERFLDEIFANSVGRISVKTRIGMSDPDEFVRLLAIFDQYPMEELILHPRLQTDYYKNRPNMEAFSYALCHSGLPIVYNGDLFSRADCERFFGSFPNVHTVMLGRGVLANPALFGEIRGEGVLEKERLFAFHERLLHDYGEVLSGETPLLFKMKDLWTYMIRIFPDSGKYAKAIKKAQTLQKYEEAVRRLFAERDVKSL